MSTHTALVNRILLRFSPLPGVTMWKLSTGVARSLYGQDRKIRFGIPGGCDIIGILAPSGRMFGIEVKTGAGRLQKNQRTFRDVIVEHGGLHCEARSEEDVEQFFEERVFPEQDKDIG